MTITEQAPAETHVVDVRVGPQPTTKPAPAETPRPSASPRTVNARPAAAFVGNAATIVGATVYAGAGVAGLVAAGAAVAATGAAGVVAKGASNRRKTGSVWRSSSASPGVRSGSGLPKLGGGRTAAGRSGGTSVGRKGAGIGGLLSGGSGAAAKKRAGATGAIPGAAKAGSGGRSGPGIGSRFRKLFGGGSAGAGKSGSPTSPTGGGSTRAASGKPSPLGRAARTVGRGLASPFRAIGNARHGLAKGRTGREAAKAAREQAKQNAAARGAKRAGWLRGWGSGLAALTAGGTRSAWRRLSGGKKAGGDEATGSNPKKPGVREVAATVRRPGVTTTAGDAKLPVPDAVPAPPQDTTAPTNNPIKSVNAGGAAMSRELYELSEQMVAAAARHQSDGMLEVGRDFNALPYIMANVAKATQMIVAKSAEEYPVHSAVIQALEMIHRTALATVQAAEQVNPAFERLHADELNRLRNPRRGEDKWDVRANRGTA